MPEIAPRQPLTVRPDGELAFLDGLRGLAAFYVVVGHARWLLWEGYREGFLRHPESYTLTHTLLVYFFSLFKYGYEAVLFFFVLSGFVIHLRYARKLVANRTEANFDWAAFVRRRGKRLYPPLLAAMALSFALDSVGVASGYSIYSQSTLYPVINENVLSHLDWLTFVGNLAYLMNTYVPVFGSDGPLWSLKFEWWFYMIYPLFWRVSKRSITAASGVMAVLFLGSFRPGLWPAALLRDVFSAMLVWWLGVLLADVWAGRIRWRWSLVAVCSFGVSAPPLFLLGGAWRQLGIGFGFAGLLAFCFELQRRSVPLVWLERLKPLGDMSYTLYVIHFPVLVLLSGWLMSRSPGGLLPRHFGWVIGGIVATVALAYGLHFIIERPFLSRAARKPAAMGHTG